MRNFFTVLLASLVLIGGISSHGYAEEKLKAAPSQIEMLDDSVMEKLGKLAEPSEQHQLLSTLMGTWYYEMLYWTKEGAESQSSTGTITNEMILGGRFLSSKTSLILNIGGQNIPYEGWGMLGYDTVEKAFTSVWVDTMHSGPITGSGKYNENLKTIEEKGFFTSPLIAKKQAYRSDLQFVDDQTYKKTFFMTGKSGKEFKVIEITFEKRQ